MRFLCHCLPALAAVALASCDGIPAEENVSGKTATESGKPIEGYGELKFGSTLMEVLAQTGSERFNSYGMKLCLDDLPLKGCFLSPASDAAPYLIEGGIPYKLGLDFNKFDKLTDIQLSYDREGKTSFDECLSLHERTLEWLAGRYGEFPLQLSAKDPLETRKTPGGVPYLLGRTKNGSFVSGSTRTAPARLPSSVRRKPITEWDNERYVWLLSHYIVVGGRPNCHVGIQFSEPESVERRPPMEEASYATPEPADEPDTVADGEPMHGPYGDEDAEPLDGNTESANIAGD